jgi:hypothetical protein
MTLTTHAIAGAAIAQLFPEHIVLAFCAGFVSHFILDSIPHWDYKIYSANEPKDWNKKLETTISSKGPVFYYDLFRIGSDFWIGILLSLILFSGLQTSPWVTLAGALGAILPDPLQFVYWKLRKGPIVYLQKFHIFMAAKIKLDDKPFIGIPFQIAVIILFVSAAYVVRLKLF